MPNFTKENPIGIDVHLQNMQIAIFENFSSTWGLLDEDWNSYGRIYRMFDNEGKEYLPYPFDSGTEYKNPVLFEDTVKLQSFFDILETQKVSLEDCQTSCNVVLYFFSNLETIFGVSNDRLDEYQSTQVASFVQQMFGFTLVSKRIGIKTIMKDWSGYSKEFTESQNMQPNYAFSLEFEISSYYICYMNQLIYNYQNPSLPSIPKNVVNTPYGIDQYIKINQINLFNFILGIFNKDNEIATNGAIGRIRNDEYDCYGRVYRNATMKSDKGKSYEPKAFAQYVQPGIKEYILNNLFEDTKSLQSFFDVGEAMRENPNSLLTYVDISLYFFVDLSKLYPSPPNTHRMDEEFIVLISQFVMENFGFQLYSIRRGIKAIFSDYFGYSIRQNSKANMQNFLCFRMDMKKYYDESTNSLDCIFNN